MNIRCVRANEIDPVCGVCSQSVESRSSRSYCRSCFLLHPLVSLTKCMLIYTVFNSTSRICPGSLSESNQLFSGPHISRKSTRNFLWPPYVIGQAVIFLPCGFFFYLLLLSFFPRLISAVADWMSTILPHMVNLLSSNTSSICPDNMVNFGPLAAEIGSGV